MSKRKKRIGFVLSRALEWARFNLSGGMSTNSTDKQQVKGTFTLQAGVGAVHIGLSIAGTVDAEILSRYWLIAVTWTQLASLPFSTVELSRLTALCTQHQLHHSVDGQTHVLSLQILNITSQNMHAQSSSSSSIRIRRFRCRRESRKARLRTF